MEDIENRAKNLIKQFNPDKLRREIRELEAKALKPNLWDDWEYGQKVMKNITDLKKEHKEIEML